jgi:hypothetical protein
MVNGHLTGCVKYVNARPREGISIGSEPPNGYFLYNSGNCFLRSVSFGKSLYMT